MSILARATKAAGIPNLSEDGSFAVSPWFLGMLAQLGVNTRSGTAVTADNALSLPTLFACVRVLSEDVASLPLIVYRRLPGGGKERATDHHLYDVFHDSPNPEMTSFGWRETFMGHLGTWGNAINEIVVDERGRTQVWPLPPQRIEIKWEDGRKAYDYLGNDGIRRRLDASRIFHVPGLSTNGLIGLSPVAVHRETIGEHFATREFGANFYRNMARPATVLSHPANLSTGAIDRLSTQMEQLRGAGNSGKTVVLEEGLTVHEIGIPPEDAQYLETRKFQREDICSMYRMPPHKVGILDHATFSNIEHQSIDYVSGTLRPWLVRIEQAIKMTFLHDEQDIFAEFLVDGLLRGDSKARAESLQIQRNAGVINGDEWREIENMNPIEDGSGKTYWMPVNYQVAGAPEEPVAGEMAEPPMLSVVKSAGEVRCASCGRLWAERAGAPYRFTCVRCKTVNESATRTAEEPDAVSGLKAAIRSLAEPPVVNIPAPIVNVAPATVTVDTGVFSEAIDNLREDLTRPRRRNLIRDDDGRLIAVES